MNSLHKSTSLDDPHFDPFRRKDNNFDVIELVKLPLVFLLLPIRLIGAFLCVFGCYVFFLLFGPAIRKEKVEDVSPARRQFLCSGGRFFSRLCLFFLGFYRIRRTFAKGFQFSDISRFALVANHTSMLDILLIMSICMPSFVSKETVSKIPLIGRIATGMQCLYVNRSSRGGVSSMVMNRQQACAQGVSNTPLLIFPEATTTNGHFLIKFHTGVFLAGLPVIPVAIKYHYRRFSPTYETIRSLSYIYKLLTQLYNQVEYVILPVYFPNEIERKDPHIYANNVRLVLQKELSVRLSESTYQDKLEYHRLLRYRQ
eukprot:jgi/Galph1/1900/GphlegSOOS_G555.1